MRWDDRARMTVSRPKQISSKQVRLTLTQLLLKLIEQNPSIVSTGAAEAIAKTWPGPEKPTGRAIQEQIKTIKKLVSTGNVTAPTTPRRGGGLTGGTSSAPRTPKTPARSTTTPAKTSSSKRSNTTSHHTSNDPPSKKRKVNGKKSSDEESEAADFTSSAEDIGDHQDESEDQDEDSVNPSTTKRQLPARSKSRSKSYIAEADSAGEDAGAKDPYSDDDAEFSLEAPLKGNTKAKLRPSATRKDGQVKEKRVDVDDATDEEAGLRDEEEESDVESRTTAGKSHQTYFDAEDDVI